MASPTIEAGYRSDEYGLGLVAHPQGIEPVDRPPTPEQEEQMYEREGVHVIRYKGALVLAEEIRRSRQNYHEDRPLAA